VNKPREISLIDKALQDRIRLLVKGEAPWPLLLHGPAGCGKTCAALCLLDHVGRGFYFTAADLCDKIIQAQKGELQTEESGWRVSPQGLWKEITSTPLVVLDELGAREKVSDFHYDTVKRVLDEREGQPLVCLSNHGIEELARVYDDRVASRLAAGTILALDGADRRLST
jgi:DNA replication protein DnaC